MGDVLHNGLPELFDPFQARSHVVEGVGKLAELGIGRVGYPGREVAGGDRSRGLRETVEWAQDAAQEPPGGKRAQRNAHDCPHHEDAGNVGIEHRLCFLG